MPTSAIRVFESLGDRPLSSKEIARLTSLSERTVRYALRILKQKGLVEEVFFLGDTRRRGYRRAVISQ